MKTKSYLRKFPHAERMRNCLIDLACPKCGSRAAINIQVKRWVSLDDSGTDDVGGDTEYEPRNPAHCAACGHTATVSAFTFSGLDDAIEEQLS